MSKFIFTLLALATISMPSLARADASELADTEMVTLEETAKPIGYVNLDRMTGRRDAEEQTWAVAAAKPDSDGMLQAMEDSLVALPTTVRHQFPSAIPMENRAAANGRAPVEAPPTF